MSDSAPSVGSPAELAQALEATGYLADDGVAMAAFLALRMGRPLFCEGEPGTGKTSLAAALSEAFGLPLIRLQCHEGIDAAQALYDWDFPRQLLHLRTLEAASGGHLEADAAERSLYTDGSCWRGRCCGHSPKRRACCSSTRSTGPTTNSKRSCCRCSTRTLSASPNSGKCGRRHRLWWW